MNEPTAMVRRYVNEALMRQAEIADLPLTVQDVQGLTQSVVRALTPSVIPIVHIKPRITQQRREVLDGIAMGETVQETGDRLGIGYETSRSHRTRLLTQLGARNAPQAVAIAIGLGLITVKPTALVADGPSSEAATS